MSSNILNSAAFLRPMIDPLPNSILAVGPSQLFQAGWSPRLLIQWSIMYVKWTASTALLSCENVYQQDLWNEAYCVLVCRRPSLYQYCPSRCTVYYQMEVRCRPFTYLSVPIFTSTCAIALYVRSKGTPNAGSYHVWFTWNRLESRNSVSNYAHVACTVYVLIIESASVSKTSFYAHIPPYKKLYTVMRKNYWFYN